MPEYREAQSTSFSDAGRTRLKELRAEGIDPSHTGEATEKRRTIMDQRRREDAEWDAAHCGVEVDESVFYAEILPQLQDLSISNIEGDRALSAVLLPNPPRIEGTASAPLDSAQTPRGITYVWARSWNIAAKEEGMVLSQSLMR